MRVYLAVTNFYVSRHPLRDKDGVYYVNLRKRLYSIVNETF